MLRLWPGDAPNLVAGGKPEEITQSLGAHLPKEKKQNCKTDYERLRQGIKRVFAELYLPVKDETITDNSVKIVSSIRDGACRFRLVAFAPSDTAQLHLQMTSFDELPQNMFTEAVEMAKLSLWLATLAKDHPFTFLDHSLRCGDSLVGLSREQIAAFHWQPPAKRSNDDVWFGDPIAERMKTVTEYRQRILAARDDKPYEQLRQELDIIEPPRSNRLPIQQGALDVAPIGGQSLRGAL